jgi:hypothetical protein
MLPSSLSTSSILLLLTLSLTLTLTVSSPFLPLSHPLSPSPSPSLCPYSHSHPHPHCVLTPSPTLTLTLTLTHCVLTLSTADTEVVISKAESKTLRNRILGLVWQHIAWLLCGLIGAAMVRTYALCVRARKTLHEYDSIDLLSADIESVSTHSLHLATALASSPFLYLFTVALNSFPCVSLVPSSLTLSISPYRNHT